VIGPGPSAQTESEQGSVAGSGAVERDFLSENIVLVGFGRAMSDLKVERNAGV
jgi:hypothetical protein